MVFCVKFYVWILGRLNIVSCVYLPTAWIIIHSFNPSFIQSPHKYFFEHPQRMCEALSLFLSTQQWRKQKSLPLWILFYRVKKTIHIKSIKIVWCLDIVTSMEKIQQGKHKKFVGKKSHLWVGVPVRSKCWNKDSNEVGQVPCRYLRNECWGRNIRLSKAPREACLVCWRIRPVQPEWNETLTFTLMMFVCFSVRRRINRENITKPNGRKSFKKEVNKAQISQNIQGEENENNAITFNADEDGHNSVMWSQAS